MMTKAHIPFTAPLRWIFLILLLSFPLTAKTEHADAAAQISVADVRVDGKVLFRVRGMIGYPAQRRADEIAERIIGVAKSDESIDTTVHLEPRDIESRLLFAGDTMLATLFQADAKLEGIDLDIFADVVSQRVKESIAQYRKDRSLHVIGRNIAYAFLLTLLFAGVLFSLGRLFRWFDRLAEQRLKKQIKSLEEKSLKLVRAQQVWGGLRSILTALRWLLILIAGYFFLNSILTLLPITREVGNQLFSFILPTLKQISGGIISFIPNLIFLVILIILVRYILRSIRALFNAIQYGSVAFENFEPEWAWPTYKVVRFVVIIFALVIAYPYIPGSDSGAFKGISLFLGVLLSLGSTSAIANIIAGYSMMYRRAFHIGDLVQIGDTMGYVIEMRLLVTHLRTLKNEEVVLPNSMILNGTVINYSSLAEEDGLILHTTVGIGYEVPWRQVEAMLLMAAERTTGLLKDPLPFVLKKSLGDFAVNYELNVYCQNADGMGRKYSELHQNILDVFNEYGVQIMTPNYEGDPAEPKLVSKEHWYDAPAASPAGRN